MGWLDFDRLGFNYRLSDIACAIGLVQLERLDAMLADRAGAAALYREALAGIEGLDLPCADSGGDRRGWFVFVVQLPRGVDRDATIRALRERGVQSKPYLPAIHLMTFYRETFGHREGEFPVCEDVAARSVALPFFPGLSEGQIERVAGAARGPRPLRPAPAPRAPGAQVRALVEAAHPPAPLGLGQQHEPRQRAVVGVHEGERPAAAGLPAQLADDAAVDDGGDRRAGLQARDHAVEAGLRARREVLHRLGARDDVPALRAEHLRHPRVATAHGDPKRAAVELAEMDLAQLGHDDGFEPGPRRERRRGLRGAAQRRDVERRQRLAARCAATACAWRSPTAESAGSACPSSSSNGSSSTAASEAPWRTSTTSIEPGGRE